MPRPYGEQIVRIEPAAALVGDVAVPGDKSISHRVALLGAVAERESELDGFGVSEDTLASVDAVRALGAEAEVDGDKLRVEGVGLRGLREPAAAIDCGNAGTLMRLLPGLLAGQEGSFELVGDESLSRRPLDRIADPLREMGAAVKTTDGHAPLRITGGELRRVRWELPVASAQVKSCVLLAGLLAGDGATAVVEPSPTRDHTERLLQAAGARVRSRSREVRVWPAERLQPLRLEIPGDFSSAAPFVAATTLLAGSSVRIHGVGVNPTRTGFLTILERMGARIALYNRRQAGGEPVADLEIEPAELVATQIGPAEVPLLIDELPLFALVAGLARGESVVTGAQELRVKESDRLESVKEALRPLGIRIHTTDDGFKVQGVPTRPRGGTTVDARGDHRIAMLGAVAGLVSREGVELQGAETVAVSFPDFLGMLDTLAQR
jgi:3-phosphoshikimate 1-carboxyvinyltransferase